MFAYCSNCPIIFYDPIGLYSVATDFGFSGGGVGITGGTSPCSTTSISYEIGKNSNEQASGFSTAKRKFRELFHEIQKIYSDFESIPDIYPEVKVYQGGKDIKSGIDRIVLGTEYLFSPLPTCVEDVIGVGCITWGILQTTGGFVKMLLGFDDLDLQ